MRTPITAIRAASEILHDEDDTIPKELRKQFLQNIISESDRLNRLIDKILDLEKNTNKRMSEIFYEEMPEKYAYTLVSLLGKISKRSLWLPIERS